MRLASCLWCSVLAVALGGCTETVDPAAGMGRVRVVNSIFQGDSAAVAIPVAIDVLVDSSTNGAGIAGLAPGLSAGSASGDGAGAPPGTGALFTAAGYRDLPSGVHGFVARVNGSGTPSFFQTDYGEYIPRQNMVAFPYTFVLAGVVPETTPPSPDAVVWAMVLDDPFTPPTDSAGGLTARVQVINAAPMADPSGQGTEITATFDDAAGGVYSGTASYRMSSGYLNPPPGTYTLTLETATDTLFTGTVTLAKGEVRTFIVQSTAYAAVPGPGNTTVTNVLDNKW